VCDKIFFCKVWTNLTFMNGNTAKVHEALLIQICACGLKIHVFMCLI